MCDPNKHARERADQDGSIDTGVAKGLVATFE
jgi:hypothetical protein